MLQALGQDFQLSQYYAAPLWHNPAFTGSTFGNRLIFNYRNQWPTQPANFQTYAAGFDTYLEDINGGLGIQIYQDMASTAGLQNTSVLVSYAYYLELNRNWNLNMGLQLGLLQRSMSLGSLIFGDQISGPTFNPSTTDPLASNSFSSIVPEVNGGLLAYNKHAWLGLAVQHLNQASINTPGGSSSKLDMRITLTGGYRLAMQPLGLRSRASKPWYLIPSALLRHQGRFTQFELGANAELLEVLVLGAHYRGLIVKSAVPGTINQDAVTALAGIMYKGFQFAYSYDHNLSGAATIGAHEISLQWNWQHPPKRKRKFKPIPCPKF